MTPRRATPTLQFQPRKIMDILIIASAGFEISVGKIVAWLVVGGLAGNVAGAIVKRKKEGYGKMKNMLIGLAGAVIGGLAVNLFKIDFGLGKMEVTFEELLFALLGSLLLVFVLWVLGKQKAKKAKAAAKG